MSIRGDSPRRPRRPRRGEDGSSPSLENIFSIIPLSIFFLRVLRGLCGEILFCSFLFATAVSLTGCGRVADYARVVEANRLYERGDYQGAILSYLRSGREAFPATVDYDLANVYARLGEYDAATELYDEARREADRALAADASFNEGLAFFERGGYEEAWKYFRAALSGADPASTFAREARRNLELAWRAWKKSSLAAPKGAAPTARGAAGGDESELRLLQRLETGRWKPGGAESPPSAASDY
jgi:tetratricopeptide (TPR) repeat protein